MKFWGTSGAILAFLSVALGAFAAHGLGDQFEKLYAETPAKMVAGHPVPAAQKYLADFKTGAEYQFYHALALLFVSLLSRDRSGKLLNVAGWCFLLGTLFFSGSLYLLTMLAIPVFGAITPIGGVLFLIGWAALAGSFLSNSKQKIGD